MAYRIAGIRIVSDVGLDAAYPPSGADGCDAVIRKPGPVADRADWGNAGIRYVRDDDRLSISHPTAGLFSIARGREIEVFPRCGVSEADLGEVAITTPLAALFLQRNIVTLHASAICADGGAWVFMGATGSGKSCLAAWFRRNGHAVLADDITVLGRDGHGSSWAARGDARVKLSDDSAGKWLLPGDDAAPLRAGVAKHVLPPCGGDAIERRPVRRLFVLETSNRPEVSIAPIDEKQRARLLIRNSYRGELLKVMGREGDYRREAVQTTAGTPLFLISMPRGLEAIEAVCTRLLEGEGASPR